MLDFPILLADFGDIVRLLLIFLFVVGPLLSKMLSSKDEVKPNRPMARPLPPPHPPGQAARDEDGFGDERAVEAKRQAAGREALDAEIEQFLRKTRQGQGAAVGDQPSQSPSTAYPSERTQQPSTTIIQGPAARRNPSRTRANRPAKGQYSRPPVPAVLVDSQRRAVDHADERLEQHRQDVFEHTLGSLKTTMAGRDEVRTAAEAAAMKGKELPAESTSEDIGSKEVLRLLRSPQGVRDAMILTEILRRPEY